MGSARDEIGNYYTDPKDNKPKIKPDPKGTEETLYQGIEAYQADYSKKVQDFEALFVSPDKRISTDTIDSKNPRYFRDRFLTFVEALNLETEKNYNGTEKFRKLHPGKAAARMKDLFGKEGTRLYQLALEEEMNSKEFMDAIYDKSTEKIDGEKWTERPILIISGPSGAGKTTAAKAAREETSNYLNKESGNNEGNHVVYIDGGKIRETSQIRKLAIKVANNKGYTGIYDIQKRSGILDKAKDKLYHYALNHTEHGLIIPETFSYFFNPFDRTRKMLKELAGKSNAKVIFTRVVGKNHNTFRNVVANMGSRRAWKRDFSSPTQPTDKSLHLNTQTDTESKAYGASGFTWGIIGSKLAEMWFKANSKAPLTMHITNDLVLKKPDIKDENGYWKKVEIEKKGEKKVQEWQWHGKWIDAKKGETADVFMLSARDYGEWQKTENSKKRRNQSSSTLAEFMHLKNERMNNNKPASPLIQSSAQIQVEVLKAEFLHLTTKKAQGTLTVQEGKDLTFLNKIHNCFYPTTQNVVTELDLKNRDHVSRLLQQLHALQTMLKDPESNKQIEYTNEGMAKLNQLIKGLEELKRHLPRVEVPIENRIIYKDSKDLLPEDFNKLFNAKYISTTYSINEFNQAKRGACIFLLKNSDYARNIQGIPHDVIQGLFNLNYSPQEKYTEDDFKTAKKNAYIYLLSNPKYFKPHYSNDQLKNYKISACVFLLQGNDYASNMKSIPPKELIALLKDDYTGNTKYTPLEFNNAKIHACMYIMKNRDGINLLPNDIKKSLLSAFDHAKTKLGVEIKEAINAENTSLRTNSLFRQKTQQPENPPNIKSSLTNGA